MMTRIYRPMAPLSQCIHDFHAFSGLNPSAYLTERGEYLNYVPIRR